MRKLLSALFALLLIAVPARADFAPPAWTKDATIYEVNIRQYTPEGTFRAFEKHLPRLAGMGVRILWIMPIHPIGVQARKGGLGSYYSVKDYKAVNPEFGTEADFRALVKAAHARGMKVIIDWVANHSAFDNPWVAAHPDWYKKNEKGEIFPVTFGEGPNAEQWTDVTAFDYRSTALRAAMIDALDYWVRTAGIDGFRCDVAELVPLDFWQEARSKVGNGKPLFWLAEGAKPDLHAAFDMTYDWKLWQLMVDIAKGKDKAASFPKWYAERQKEYPAGVLRMNFTTNHDQNSWQGSDKELYGPAFAAMATVSALLPGMPLIYSGQEAQNEKRLLFFERDTIDWKNKPLNGFYAGLAQLKRKRPALSNDTEGGSFRILPQPDADVLVFERARRGDRLRLVANLSSEPAVAELPGKQSVRLSGWQTIIYPGIPSGGR